MVTQLLQAHESQESAAAAEGVPGWWAWGLPETKTAVSSPCVRLLGGGEHARVADLLQEDLWLLLLTSVARTQTSGGPWVWVVAVTSLVLTLAWAAWRVIHHQAKPEGQAAICLGLHPL